MISIRLQATKILITTLVVMFISNAHGSPTHHHKYTGKRNTPYRKFNTAAFFQGLANSCAHVGTTINAQTEKEKQQAACNVLASVFQTAAAISEKTEKKCALSPHDATANTITATIDFLRNLPLQERDHLLTPDCTYLRAIIGLPTQQDQARFITQTLANKEEGKVFVGELFSLFKTLIDDQFPTIFDALQTEVVKNLNLN